MEMLHFQRLLPPTSLVGWPFSDHRSPLWGFPGSRPWVKNGDERSRYWEKKAGPIGVIPTELREPTFWQPSHIYIYMYEIIHYAGKQNMYKHTAQACLELVVGKWKIFSCWKSARLPLIFGNYIFGNYSFGKYFLSLQYRTGFRLKKSLGIFMTIGDPCGNLDDHLDMAPFFMACITPGVGDSWCVVPGENMEPNKNRGI